MFKLLLIEDEVKTAQSLKHGLEEHSFATDLAYDGNNGLDLAQSRQYDLIISDVIMPGINGLQLCKQLRDSGNQTPMIMLTALGMTSDKIAGFDAGTDDYLVKPFEFEELLARIKSLIKRSKAGDSVGQVITFADLTINVDTKEVARAGRNIVLTAKEFALLEYLVRNKGRVISKMEIAEKVWDIHFDTGTNVIEVYVSYLRNKIDRDFPTKLIHTRIGMGYVLKEE